VVLASAVARDTVLILPSVSRKTLGSRPVRRAGRLYPNTAEATLGHPCVLSTPTIEDLPGLHDLPRRSTLFALAVCTHEAAHAEHLQLVAVLTVAVRLKQPQRDPQKRCFAVTYTLAGVLVGPGTPPSPIVTHADNTARAANCDPAAKSELSKRRKITENPANTPPPILPAMRKIM
jgi:hypothetical protein